jgi:MFS family permease
MTLGGNAARKFRLPEGLKALQHRDFALFWSGQLVSLIGTWMQTLGQSWLVLRMTESPFLLGVITTIQTLPFLLLGLFAGAITDRLPKRKLIIITQTASMILAFALAILVWTGVVRFWMVAILALLLGIVNAIDMPARQAFMVEMVGKEDLMNAIALNSAVFNGARIFGPTIAGFVIDIWGVAPGFFLNGVSFIAVIAALCAIKAPGLPHPRKEGVKIMDEVKEGVSYAFHNPTTALTLSLIGTVGLFLLNWGVLVPLLADQILHSGAEGLGIIQAGMGLGALVGALTLAAMSRHKPNINAMIWPSAIMCAASVLVGFLKVFNIEVVLMVLVGFTQILFTGMCNTLLQVNTPDRLRGRVMSLYALGFNGTTPIGAAIIGLVSEYRGSAAGWIYAGSAGLLSTMMLALWWYMRGSRRLVAESAALDPARS